MKKIFKVFAVFAAASALFACNKETLVEEQISETKTGPGIVQFSAGPITKTVFGTPVGTSVPTLWTDKYAVALSLNLATAKKSTTPAVSGGGTSASFSAEIDDDSSSDYNFYAVSPYDAVLSINNTYKSILINFPTAQTPSASSPDELAQIIYAKNAAGSTFPTSVTMSFSHISAYGKIGFKNLALSGGETIQSVSLTADENWAGRFYYYAEDYSTYTAGDIVENSASSTITITTSSTTDIWFGCAPVDLGGKNVDVVVTTNLGTFSKTITIPSGKKFESGKVAAFNVDMDGIARVSPVVYTLVDDVDDLTVGSEVIIVAKDSDVAISTTQNTNNRGQAGITKSGSTISSPGADVQVFTIQNGNKAGTYAFYTGSGYIYAASSSANQLKTESTLSNNSSWYISIAADGEATVKAVGDNTRNVLQHNSGSSIFACYGSASQGAVVIYKKNGTGSSAITPKEAESLSISGATTSYSVGDTYSFDGTVTVLYSDTSTETLTSSDYTVDDSAVDMSTADTYTVTISYNANPSVTGSYDITVTGGGSLTVWNDDFSSVTGTSSITSLNGSLTGYTGAYSGFTRVYAMTGALKVGTASNTGSITTPALAGITSASADLTITVLAAGWKGKTTTLTVSASTGTVTEGATSIASEDSMSGTSPSMTGTTYTFHVTGANSSTTITFATNLAVGIDDIKIIQTN